MALRVPCARPARIALARGCLRACTRVRGVVASGCAAMLACMCVRAPRCGPGLRRDHHCSRARLCCRRTTSAARGRARCAQRWPWPHRAVPPYAAVQSSHCPVVTPPNAAQRRFTPPPAASTFQTLHRGRPLAAPAALLTALVTTLPSVRAPARIPARAPAPFTALVAALTLHGALRPERAVALRFSRLDSSLFHCQPATPSQTRSTQSQQEKPENTPSRRTVAPRSSCPLAASHVMIHSVRCKHRGGTPPRARSRTPIAHRPASRRETRRRRAVRDITSPLVTFCHRQHAPIVLHRASCSPQERRRVQTWCVPANSSARAIVVRAAHSRQSQPATCPLYPSVSLMLSNSPTSTQRRGCMRRASRPHARVVCSCAPADSSMCRGRSHTGPLLAHGTATSHACRRP